jgi:hypothetical protein
MAEAQMCSMELEEAYQLRARNCTNGHAVVALHVLGQLMALDECVRRNASRLITLSSNHECRRQRFAGAHGAVLSEKI